MMWKIMENSVKIRQNPLDFTTASFIKFPNVKPGHLEDRKNPHHTDGDGNIRPPACPHSSRMASGTSRASGATLRL